MTTFIPWFVFFAAAFVARPATASVKEPVLWHTSSHLGIVTNDRSSTNFKNAVGATTFFDLAADLDEDWSLGMRTSTGDSHGPQGSYYRLAAGPMFRCRLNSKWSLHGAVGIFKESAEAQGTQLYSSKGYQAMVGWERIYPIYKWLEWGWGGFWSYHDGSVNRLNSTIFFPERPQQAKITNRGYSRGVEFSLRIRM